MSDEVLELGDLELESGETLRGARLLYTTHGTLNEARDNAILYPHMYSGTPSSLESTIAPGRALDPERWFIVCPAQLGDGLSSSPSNTDGAFPDVSVGDDVTAQYRLVTDVLGIDRLALAVGFSMGAQQAYDWAVRYPDMVERLAAVAGNARTTAYNALVLRFAEEALEEAPTPEDGLRRHAHVWAATGLSPELYRTEGWRDAGFASVGDLVQRLFEEDMALDESRQPPLHVPEVAAVRRIEAHERRSGRGTRPDHRTDAGDPVLDRHPVPGRGVPDGAGADPSCRASRDREPVGTLVVGDDSVRDRASWTGSCEISSARASLPV